MLLLGLYHSCKMQLIKTSESKASFVCDSAYLYIKSCSCLGVQPIFPVGGGKSLSEKIVSSCPGS